ncbi:MAG: hypothetical protein MJZ02_00910, partial [Paludibacteraceae bacterium]|nr:hypothetical protein [Paludibacteraceae bacterium]
CSLFEFKKSEVARSRFFVAPLSGANKGKNMNKRHILPENFQKTSKYLNNSMKFQDSITSLAR